MESFTFWRSRRELGERTLPKFLKQLPGKSLAQNGPGSKLRMAHQPGQSSRYEKSMQE